MRSSFIRVATFIAAFAAIGILYGSDAAAEPKKPQAKPVAALRFDAADFTAKLPWFYHGMPFDKQQDHDVCSFEANALNLKPGTYAVAIVPRTEETKTLSVSFDGVNFRDVPVEQGRAALSDVEISNRMLSFYVKATGPGGENPMQSVVAYPPGEDFAKAAGAAAKFKQYRRDILSKDRDILKKENWDEFYRVLNRQSFGKEQLHAMFDRIVEWCKRRQVLDADDIHYGAIYSEEDKYCFRDAMAAAVCFTYAWRDSGDEDYHRRALLARNYALKGQHLEDPGDKLRYGCFAHMIHGAWGPGMQRLRPDGKFTNASGVETGVITNLLVKTFELGLEPTESDLKHLEAAAVWAQNNEFSPGSFSHDAGATHDCQNTNALGAETLTRAYYALKKYGKNPPDEWLVAARRGLEHFIEGQEAVGCWPYVFAVIGRGQAFSERNIPDQGMGFYHFAAACDSPAFRDLPGAKAAMLRAARWWLCASELDREGAETTINLDDSRAGGPLKFSKFTWCRFMAAASLMRIAEMTGEKEPWQSLAMRYMEHVDAKLRNEKDADKGPYKRATIDEMTLCSWIQAVEWAGVLLREMEERL